MIYLWSICSSLWRALTIIFVVSRSSKQTSVQKWRYIWAGCINTTFLVFFYRRLKKTQNHKPETGKLSAPLMQMLIQWAAFFFFNLFFNSGSRKYSKQTSEVFFHMRQVSSFPDYNRFLTSLRWDELIQVRRLRLKFPHHQLEVPFCATNESHGIGSLVHSHTNFPIIRDSHYHLYSLTKEILSVCHIFCLERWKNLFVLDRTPKIKFW